MIIFFVFCLLIGGFFGALINDHNLFGLAYNRFLKIFLLYYVY
jgi:hypothetical protein